MKRVLIILLLLTSVLFVNACSSNKGTDDIAAVEENNEESNIYKDEESAEEPYTFKEPAKTNADIELQRALEENRELHGEEFYEKSESERNYIHNVTSYIKAYQIETDKLIGLIQESTEVNYYVDEDWIMEMAFALAEIPTITTKVSNTYFPDELEELFELLNNARLNYIYVDTHLPVAIDRKNHDAVQECLHILIETSDYLEEALLLISE